MAMGNLTTFLTTLLWKILIYYELFWEENENARVKRRKENYNKNKENALKASFC